MFFVMENDLASNYSISEYELGKILVGIWMYSEASPYVS